MSQAAVGVVLSINIVGKAEIYIDVLTWLCDGSQAFGKVAWF